MSATPPASQPPEGSDTEGVEAQLASYLWTMSQYAAQLERDAEELDRVRKRRAGPVALADAAPEREPKVDAIVASHSWPLNVHWAVLIAAGVGLGAALAALVLNIQPVAMEYSPV